MIGADKLILETQMQLLMLCRKSSEREILRGADTPAMAMIGFVACAHLDHGVMHDLLLLVQPPSLSLSLSLSHTHTHKCGTCHKVSPCDLPAH